MFLNGHIRERERERADYSSLLSGCCVAPTSKQRSMFKRIHQTEGSAAQRDVPSNMFHFTSRFTLPRSQTCNSVAIQSNAETANQTKNAHSTTLSNDDDDDIWQPDGSIPLFALATIWSSSSWPRSANLSERLVCLFQPTNQALSSFGQTPIIMSGRCCIISIGS